MLVVKAENPVPTAHTAIVNKLFKLEFTMLIHGAETSKSQTALRHSPIYQTATAAF